MATTYIPIATQTVVNTSTNTITLNSIPSTYTDLVLVCNYGQSANSGIKVLVNNDSTSGLYSMTRILSNGTTATSSRRANQNQWYIPEGPSIPTNVGAMTILNFMNYANTAVYKTVLQRDSVGDSGVATCANLWRSKSAIDRIDIICLSTDVFANGSTFSLYGITAATVGAKATGGDIIGNDGIYYYHAFRSSGTFTPSQALTCDIITIAGGGGGGTLGGGGGAGGLLYSSAQALTATGYTVTIGAGGNPAIGGGAATGTLAGQGSSTSFGGSLIAIGGGGGGSWENRAGTTGGSGGGAEGSGAKSGYAGTAGQGNKGGDNIGGLSGGGGGGSGAVGGNNVSTTVSGAGGNGTNAYSSWLSYSGSGVNGYIAAGGGGGNFSGSLAAGGLGGGGTGGNNGNTVGGNGAVNTGSGAGSGGFDNSAGNKWASGGTGGSGLVIVRYPI
jgi:hypothetical protein